MAPRIGHAIIELDACASTNDEADRRAREGAEHGTVVIARRQTAGRGRAGRSWFSDDGDNLYLSCVLRPPLAPASVPPITLAAGVAVCDAVNSIGCRASLKWPNDVQVDGYKVAGILTEMSTLGNDLEFVILGIGVNVNGRRFPPELARIATSLRLALGDRAVDAARFRGALLDRLDLWIGRFVAGGVSAIAPAWEARSHMIGAAVAIAGDPEVRGRAVGLDVDGALVVELAGGGRRRVVAGDVAVLR